MTIRITSGRFRGRGIESPPRSRPIRPTSALIRESVFNRFQDRLESARFLDLFAGSGIMGLEALSRGAAFVLAIESDVRQCRRIRDHFEAFGLTPAQARAIPADAAALLEKFCREEPFDWIFMDPPYGFAALPRLAEQCRANGWIREDGIILVEHGCRDPDLPGFSRRDYGDSSISTLLHSASGPQD
jgi:16S rRNA (guanine966-N2)-methyltransferase